MARITDPMALFGAAAYGRSGGRLPMTIVGAADPVPVHYELPMPSAQVKSAVLLAGLNAPGETVVIEIINDTRWPHAMHLHGHHFRRLGEGGAPGPFRDTTLVAPGDRADLAFVADNPGGWLLHCHMLEHSAAGMSTWVAVG